MSQMGMLMPVHVPSHHHLWRLPPLGGGAASRRRAFVQCACLRAWSVWWGLSSSLQRHTTKACPKEVNIQNVIVGCVCVEVDMVRVGNVRPCG